MATGEEILLGRLAVQAGYVTQEQVLATLRARNQDPEGPDLGELLVRRGHLTVAALEQLQEAAARGGAAPPARMSDAPTDHGISLGSAREVIARECLAEARALLPRDRPAALREIRRLALEFTDTESGVAARELLGSFDPVDPPTETGLTPPPPIELPGARSGAPPGPEDWTPTARLTHLDERGAPRMVDVSPKGETERLARARARVRMREETRRLIAGGGVAKGDVLGVARLAGIMAAKRTHELIPLCHPLRLTSVEVDLTTEAPGLVTVEAVVRARDRTGVEMEALVAASTAALTVYDMCKAVDRWMTIEAVELVEKRGGKSGTLVREEA